MKTQVPEVKAIAAACFPSYAGRKFSIQPLIGEMRCDSYWSGGSRDFWGVVNLDTLKSEPVPENGTPFSNGGKIFKIESLPFNAALVCHSISCGKDLGITIYLHPDNIRADMLPAPVELSWGERVVLSATRSLKSSYAGIKNYRFSEAASITGITQSEYESAKAQLVWRGLLNKAGAITDDGKNAIGWTNLSEIKREVFVYINPKITLEVVTNAVESDDNIGFCTSCGFEHCGGCDPDMRKGRCDSCDAYAVYGAEELLIRMAF